MNTLIIFVAAEKTGGLIYYANVAEGEDDTVILASTVVIDMARHKAKG